MEHPVFETAGAQAGIEIWTIETTGDNTSTLSYDVHFWLGSKTTHDKKGSAAIHTVILDDQLGGGAVHHREVQGHESTIRYIEGGNESGFTEVLAEASSLTKEHCFILEVDHDIFVLMPEGARATQRRKIISVANTLRDDYHNGRATIEIIALGSGSLEDIQSDKESIALYSRESMTSVYLYKIVYGEEIELDPLNKPFKQSQLSSEEIYILDTPCSGVYIWIGKEVDADIKKNYNDIVQKITEEPEDVTERMEALPILYQSEVYVPQGKEPKHFLKIFKGNLGILYGSEDNDYKPENYNKSYDDNGVRLFRVEGTDIGVDMRITQVPETVDTLEDDDVYVLETPDFIFVWNGKVEPKKM
ncbi:unnamed protein product [Leptidea sinapis]|uniref:Gelsolin-like domain-containing protein n=1 Tax=Leptidea sinapis TaxID=189913 RepID=A0A5E4QNH4_9NEOP|nr:unnamed protein product [Leptidea sinapis]